MDYMDAARFASMDNDEAGEYIVEYEKWIKEKLKISEISEEQAWDLFFCLLHECDERGLVDDRQRILFHIDTDRYNPFESNNVGVRFIAQLRARGMGLVSAERN